MLEKIGFTYYDAQKNKEVDMLAPVRVCVFFFFMVLLAVSGLLLVPGEGYTDTCPPGSYQRSCNMNSAVCSARSISASCKTMSGSWKSSRLSLPCNQEISNCDGVLRCLCGSACPTGSYNQSCWCCYVQGSTLGCFCKNKQGKSVPTTLSGYAGCKPNSIWNDNGRLKCKR